MEFVNMVINDEQCVQKRFIEVEDALPKEYVENPTNEELLILNDIVSKPTILVRETP